MSLYTKEREKELIIKYGTYAVFWLTSLAATIVGLCLGFDDPLDQALTVLGGMLTIGIMLATMLVMAEDF